MGKKVNIYVWIVTGDGSRTICLSEKAANDINVGLGGWGTIEKQIRKAEMAKEKQIKKAEMVKE